MIGGWRDDNEIGALEAIDKLFLELALNPDNEGCYSCINYDGSKDDVMGEDGPLINCNLSSDIVPLRLHCGKWGNL